MSESLVDLGLDLVCATCRSEIDFPDDTDAGVGLCRQCGMAFLLDVPARSAAGSA